MNLDIIAHGRRKLAQLLPIQHVNCSAALFSYLDCQPDLKGWDGGALFTYVCTFMFSCVVLLLSWYHQTIFLEVLVFIFFDISWVFFLGVDIAMTMSHFVPEKVSYEPHLKLAYRSSQKPHTLSYESRRGRFNSFLIHVWDLLVIQSTVAFLFSY